jgi:ribokinase
VRDRNGTLVVGSATIDVTAYADRAPRAGETVLGRSSTLVPGGKGANQAMAAAQAGCPTAIVGCVGDDVYGHIVIAALDERGVDLAYLRQVSGPTGLAHIRVNSSGENDIVIIPNANGALAEEWVEQAIAAADIYRVLLIQLEIPLNVIRRAARAGAAGEMIVILDPAPAAELPEEVWADIDIVTPNETEAEELTGIAVTDAASAARAGAWFLERGVSLAIITRASAGVVVVRPESTTELPPTRPVEVVDTTAAGDAFAGYLAGALAGGALIEDAIHRGMAAGALAVTRPGASTSIPTRADVDAFLKE